MKLNVRTVAENGLIVLGLLALWPYILGYRGWWSIGFATVVLALLAVLAVIRVQRTKREFDAQERRLRNGPQPPQARADNDREL
jgi:hypothetical protein